MTANHHETCGICHASGSCEHNTAATSPAKCGNRYRSNHGDRVCARDSHDGDPHHWDAGGVRWIEGIPLPGVPWQDRALKAEKRADELQRDLDCEVKRVVDILDHRDKLQSDVDRLTAEVARMQGEVDGIKANRDRIVMDRNREIDCLQSALAAEKRAHASTRADLISSEAQRKGAIDAIPTIVARTVERETKKLRDDLAALRASHEASEKECERLRGVYRERGALIEKLMVEYVATRDGMHARLKSAEERERDKYEALIAIDKFALNKIEGGPFDEEREKILSHICGIAQCAYLAAPAPTKREEAPAIPSSVYPPVLAFFDSDHDKANEWFRTFNPLLGMTPMDLIALGKVDRLKAFIETQLAENAPAMQDERCDKCGVDGSLYRSEFKAFDKALRDEVASHDRTRADLARCTQERDAYAQAAADRGEERDYYKNDRDSHEAQWRVAYQSVLDDRAALESNATDLTQRILAADTKARGLELELAAERARGMTLQGLLRRLRDSFASDIEDDGLMDDIAVALERK